MNDLRENRLEFRPNSVNRRQCLTSIAVGITAFLAGCSQRDCNTSSTDCTDETIGQSDDGLSRPYRRVRGNITSILDILAERPIREGATFDFDIDDAMSKGEMEELASAAIETVQASRELEDEEGREELIDSARLAALLVDQRVGINQFVMAGYSYSKRFGNGEYEAALELIENGSSTLEFMLENGGEIKKQLGMMEESSQVVERYGTGTIQRDLEVLLEVIRWSSPIYAAFENTAQGMTAIETGNELLESEDYTKAREHYEHGRHYFEEAQRAFDVAHGSGQQVDIFVPYVDGLRCLVPGLISCYKNLDEGLQELAAGNEEIGLEIAAQALTAAERKLKRCN